jgi:hypothetical protein
VNAFTVIFGGLLAFFVITKEDFEADLRRWRGS